MTSCFRLYILFGIVLLIQQQKLLTEGTVCFQCDSIPYAKDVSTCTKEVTCRDTQICFVSLFVNALGQANHKTGCSDKQLCTQGSSAAPGIVGKRDITVCRRCCSGDKCNNQPCQVTEQCSDWEKWTKCDVTCGGGKQTRARKCNHDTQQTTKNETRDCNTQICPVLHTACKDFLDDCSSPTIKQTMCSSESVGLKYCQNTCGLCPVDGQWSGWSQWAACTASCGSDAHMIRLRMCNNPVPKYNGSACAGHDRERQDCHAPPCSVDGGWSSWSVFAACGVSCGDGTMALQRTCTNPSPNGGRQCSGDSFKTSLCHMSPCAIDGGWSAWSRWTACNASCGGGQMLRFRSCSNPIPQNSGKPCENAAQFKESKSCGTSDCQVDGNWEDWSPWHPCTVTCGGGTQFRSRTCSNPVPMHGGKPCDNPAAFVEKITCNQMSCADSGLASATTSSTATSILASITPSAVTSSTVTKAPALVPSVGCNDQYFCTDSHIQPLVCQDVYMATTYCPKLCGICGATSTRPPCMDSVGGSCSDPVYIQFACSDNELAALCAKSCGVCH